MMNTRKQLILVALILIGSVTLFSCGGSHEHDNGHDSDGHEHHNSDGHEHHDSDGHNHHDSDGHDHHNAAGHDHHDAAGHNHHDEKEHKHAHDDKAGIHGILQKYFELKDTFVESDVAMAQTKAKSMTAHLKNVHLHVNGHNADVEQLIGSIRSHLQKITETNNLESQRVQFETVSDEMYALIQLTGRGNATVYRQYCPMAFNDKGAYWLSAEKEVRNPYFGDAMLTCGSVEEEI